MINAQNKYNDQATNKFVISHTTKRPIPLKKHNRSFIAPQKTQNNEFFLNKSCPQMEKQMSPPYSQFKNKLLQYLQQSQKHERRERENLQQQQINIYSTWTNNKKQTNYTSKEQATHLPNKQNFNRKNIKRYISEVTEAKRKRNSNKNDTPTENSSTSNYHPSSLKNKSAKKEISIVVSKQETNTPQQLIPIHHTRAYFYQKEPLRKSHNSIFESALNLESSKQRQISYSQYSSIEIPQNNPQSRLEIYLNEEEQEHYFEGKFQQHQKFLSVKGYHSKFHSKNKPRLRVRNKGKKESEEQPNEISPWKRRRNTVDSQPPAD